MVKKTLRLFLTLPFLLSITPLGAYRPVSTIQALTVSTSTENDPRPVEQPSLVEMQDAQPAPAAPLPYRQTKGEDGALRLQNGDIHLASGLDPQLQDLPASNNVYVLVQYTRDPSPEELAPLVNWGYQELDYIPDGAFIVHLSAGGLETLARQDFVRSISPLQPAWKLSAGLEAMLQAEPHGLHSVKILTFEPLPTDMLHALTPTGETNKYSGELYAAQIQSFLEHPLVRWIEPQTILQGSIAQSVPAMAVDNVWTEQGLGGGGVLVGVLDSGIYHYHPHFLDTSIVNGWDWVEDDDNPYDSCNGHGTNTTGVIAGSSTYNSMTLSGVAPDATLVVGRMLNCSGDAVATTNAPAVWFNDLVNRGAVVINNSFGSSANAGQYDEWARDTDDWARTLSSIPLVFSNGNIGNGYITSPGLAKNVIAVGVTLDGSPANGGAVTLDSAPEIDLISINNALSLPIDGRTKPDINAPGEEITAPTINDGYTTQRGSSLSAPHISGLIALYLEKNPTARADLIKARLINSAVDVSAKPGQSNHLAGWGRATAYDFLYKMWNEEVDTDFLGEVGDTAPYSTEQIHVVNVPAGSKYIKVTMTYLDLPATLGANPALVNDLDLYLESPTGTLNYSWSSLNNVEQILVSSGTGDLETGDWTITVKTYNIPGAEVSQKYAGTVSVVARTPSFTHFVPASLIVAEDIPFDVDISITAEDWFSYGVYATVESKNAAIQLDSSSVSGFAPGDMWWETHQWSPKFLASTCGSYPDAVEVVIGATNHSTVIELVDVEVPCPPTAPDLIAPPNGDLTNDNTPAFNWSEPTGASQDHIQVDNDSGFGSPAVDTITSSSDYTPGSALGDDLYYWRVRAKGSLTDWGNWASAWSFTIDTQGPNAPSLLSPGNTTTTNNSTPEFDWTGVSGAVEYQLQVDDGSAFVSPTIDSTTTNTAYTPAPALSDDLYHWRVRARDVAGNWGSWSAPWTVTIDTQGPLAPGIISPANGSTTNDSTPPFDWSDVDDADKYWLQVDDSSGFGSPAVDVVPIVSTYTPSSALGDDLYYWRVRARDAAGNWGSWSAPWTVTVDSQGPAAPELYAPGNGVTTNDNTPLFDWSSPSDAELYQLQVDDSSGFGSPAIDVTPTTSSHAPGTGLGDDLYYWRARARDAAGNWGSWSAPWSFTLDTSPPAAPELFTPGNGITTNDSTPTFNWNDPAGASSYQLQVSDSATFSSQIIDVTPDVSNYIPSSGLDDGLYYWRTRARDTVGNWSGWSPTWSFTVDDQGPAAPALLAPADAALTNDSTPFFDWSDPSGATLYQLQVDSSAAFDSPDIDTNPSVSDYTLPAALGDDLYYWRVRARDVVSNWGEWSVTLSFTVDTQAPNAPGLLIPGNGDTTGDSAPTFDWTTSTGASQYQLQVDDSAAFGSPAIDVAPTVSEHTPTSPLIDNLYYWRSRARDAAGNWSNWSATWSFSVDTGPSCQTPAAPVLVSPSSTSLINDNTPAFNWNTAVYAAEYQLHVDEDPAFASLTIDHATSTTNHTPTAGLPDNGYYWRVRGHNNSDGCDLYGPWSSVWTLNVDTQPPATTDLLSPANGVSTCNRTPTLDWDEPTGAIRYRLQVDDNVDFGSTLLDVELVNSFYTFGTELDLGVVHWRVMARDQAVNWSLWSDPWELVIAADCQDVLFNEIDLGDSDAVELYNPGQITVDLSGWHFLSYMATGLLDEDYTIPDGFSLGPGAYVVIHETGGTPTVTDLYIGKNIAWSPTNSGGTAALTDGSGAGIDFVGWGDSTISPPTGTGWYDNNPAPCQDGETLGRDASSMDTDSGNDWCAQIPTLGFANLGCSPTWTYLPLVVR